jgi:hypothetical protein
MPWMNTPGRKHFHQKTTQPTPIEELGVPSLTTVFHTKPTPRMMSFTRHHVSAHGALCDAWEPRSHCYCLSSFS